MEGHFQDGNREMCGGQTADEWAKLARPGERRRMSERPSILLSALVVLALEKVVQHLFVTWALLVDFGGIRESVVVDYRLLVPTGLVVGILFAVSVPLLLRRRESGFKLLFGLAAFDVLAEFVAQGTLFIDVVVSFVVAWVIILLLLWRWWRAGVARRGD